MNGMYLWTEATAEIELKVKHYSRTQCPCI